MALTRLQASTITDSDFKTSCKVATNENIANFESGAPSSIDGVNLSISDRILVKAQDNAAENGIYTVVTVGTGSNGRWARAVDFKSNVSISSGSITFIENGTNANTFYYLAGGIGTVTVGSTNLTFKSFAVSPPGSNTQILFNNNGEFGASSSLTWNGANLAITGNILANGFYFSNGSPFTVDSTQILNGNSNVKVSANSDISISVAGNSNIVVVTGTSANVTGTLNVSGNANVGNIGAATVVATNLTGTLTTAAQPNITSVGTLISVSVTGNVGAGNLNTAGKVVGSVLESNVTTGTAPLTVISTTQVANLNSATAGHAVTANTVVDASQPNITSVGTLSSLIVSGNANVGNILAGGFYFANGSPFTVDTTQILNGNSNVLVAANSNVTVSVAGNANVVTVTGTGANISGTANVTGNVNVGNLGATTVVATDLTGNLTTAAQPNITSVGTLSTLNVLGNANTGNLGTAQVLASANITAPQLISNVTTGTAPLVVTSTTRVANLNVANAGFADNATIAGTVITAAQPNITSVGTLTSVAVTGNANVGNLNTTGDIQIGGNDIRSSTGNVAITLNDKDVTVVGNLAVQGNTYSIGSQNYSVQDSIIDLHTFPNLAPLTVDDGRDIGIRMHYFKSVDDKHAFVGWANDTGFLEYYSDATETNGVISGTYGTVKVANVFANSGVFYNGTSNLTVAASGNVTVSSAGNANILTVTGTGANISGTLNATGNANVGNLGAATVVATNLTGTLTTAAQPNITSVGTLTSLSVTGNANTGNLGTGTVIATTANLTTVNSGLVQNGNSNVTITANANVSVFVNGNATARVVFTSTGANIAGTLNATGNANVGNLGTATAIITTGNITTINSGLMQNGNSNVTITANGNVDISVAGTADVAVFTSTGANIAGYITATGNATAGNVNTAGTVTASRLISNVANGTAPLTVTSTTQVANLNAATAGSALTAGTVTTAAQPNITSLGTLTALTVNGTANLGAVGNVKITGGSANQFLKTDGAGNLSFGSAGVNFTASTTAPTSPNTGDQWYDTAADILFTRINDGSGNLWLDISSTGNTFAAITVSGNANVGTLRASTSIVGSANAFSFSITDSNSVATSNKTVSVTGGSNNLFIVANAGAGSYNPLTSSGDILLGYYASASGAGNLTIAPWATTAGGIKFVTSANVTTVLSSSNVIPTANATYTLGNSTNRWSNIWGLASSAQYADLAEKYLADESYAPSTVVIFGGKAEITVTTQSHDSRVAGVISTEPAYLMNDNQHQGNLWLPVALTGRVPCKVQGPVRKGDVLVSSNIAGVAEKLDKTQYEPGCVIGKSLENHMENTIKTIEVVVGRF